jgi:hypothetical protein
MNPFWNGLKNIPGALSDLLKSLSTIFPQLLWFLKGLWRAFLRGFRKPAVEAAAFTCRPTFIFVPIPCCTLSTG